MPLELWNTVATCGTFVVIAATAVAAVFQLRHTRGSNQIAALAELRTSFQSAEFAEAFNFTHHNVPELMQDPEFRYQILHRSARTPQYAEAIRKINFVGNYFEDMGALILAGLLDKTSTNMIYSSDVTIAWETLLPVLQITRREMGPAVWENFEYAAMLAQDWIAAHPDGNYPRGVRRAQLADPFREADESYALSRSLGQRPGISDRETSRLPS
ncbi:MAG TPA: hypothetical protein VFL13_09230 [Candidatus Baltobacteraceae bacterium]|nr:hypothetical protein [Candidatus Baltobacteraceae bacterium]